MKKKIDNPYGVDAPFDRMLLCMIYLATGKLPKNFDETWKDKLGGYDRPISK